MSIEKIITQNDVKEIVEDLATPPMAILAKQNLQAVPIRLNVREQTPGQLINLLIKANGDIWTLCQRFEGQPEHIVFAIENIMDQSSPALQANWNKILELFQRSRMRLVQRKAIAFLEEQEPSEDNKQFKDYLAFSKLALNDLFIGAAQAAKKRVDNDEPEDIGLNNILQDFKLASSNNSPE